MPAQVAGLAGELSALPPPFNDDASRLDDMVISFILSLPL